MRMVHSHLLASVGVLLLSTVLAGCVKSDHASPAFVTEYGLGPDKWAAAWLLTRHVEPGARLKVVPRGAAPVQGVPFDVPRARYRRQGELSTFEVIRRGFDVREPVVAELGRVIQDIEVQFWMEPATASASLIEQSFRDLQQRHGRDAVPAECYLAFFDKVYEALAVQQRQGGPVPSAAALEVDCEQVRSAREEPRPLVSEVSIGYLLEEMSRGKRVVFVDVREPDEFEESHIPGALNIQLRDAGSIRVEQFQDADYVVSYCVKDFRGFEMAKALGGIGVRNSVILNPYGIKGWISSGLPVAGSQGLAEAEAERALAECVKTPAPCRPGGGTKGEKG